MLRNPHADKTRLTNASALTSKSHNINSVLCHVLCLVWNTDSNANRHTPVYLCVNVRRPAARPPAPMHLWGPLFACKYRNLLGEKHAEFKLYTCHIS